MLTQPKLIDDERKGDDADEHHIELVIAGEYPAKALEAAKEPLDLVAPLVKRLVVLPGVKALLARWNDRGEPQRCGQCAGLAAFIGAVHEHMHGTPGRPQLLE